AAQAVAQEIHPVLADTRQSAGAHHQVDERQAARRRRVGSARRRCTALRLREPATVLRARCARAERRRHAPRSSERRHLLQETAAVCGLAHDRSPSLGCSMRRGTPNPGRREPIMSIVARDRSGHNRVQDYDLQKMLAATAREDLNMLSRRSFLNGTLGAGAGFALAGPNPQPAADQGARRRVIVDAQVQIWKADTPERPWTPGLRPQLPEPFGYERLHAMMNEAGVDRVVLIPPSWEGER